MSKKTELLEKAERILQEIRAELETSSEGKEPEREPKKKEPKTPTMAQMKADIDDFNAKF